jgi:hypothetical protein
MSTTLSPEQKTALIDRLLDHVTSECNSIDMEQRFRDLLDECYSFDSVGGPFVHLLPSRVLEEMSPTDFRCGVADMDTSGMVEIREEHYDHSEVEESRDEFVSDLRNELKEAEAELAAEENDDDPRNVFALRAEVERLEAEISEVESHTF